MADCPFGEWLSLGQKDLYYRTGIVAAGRIHWPPDASKLMAIKTLISLKSQV